MTTVKQDLRCSWRRCSFYFPSTTASLCFSMHWGGRPSHTWHTEASISRAHLLQANRTCALYRTTNGHIFISTLLVSLSCQDS